MYSLATDWIYSVVKLVERRRILRVLAATKSTLKAFKLYLLCNVWARKAMSVITWQGSHVVVTCRGSSTLFAALTPLSTVTEL